MACLPRPATAGPLTRTSSLSLPKPPCRGYYHLNDYWKISLGTNFLYMSPVAKAVDQIDRRTLPVGTGALNAPGPPFTLFRGNLRLGDGCQLGHRAGLLMPARDIVSPRSRRLSLAMRVAKPRSG